MKKLLILSTILLTGGLALPATAQSHRGPQSSSLQIFISGHLPCGSPIYSKRVRSGKYYYSKRLNRHEIQRYLDHQRRLAAQRDLQRRHHRAKSYRSSNYSSYYSQSRRR